VTEADLQPPLVPDGARRLLELAARRKRHLVAAWAVVVAALVLVHVRTHVQEPLLPVHSDAIVGSLAVLDRGGPPFLTSSRPYRPDLPSARLSPIGGEDRGLELYFPTIGNAVGERDPAVLRKWFFAAAFVVLVLATPLLVYELFGSGLAAFVAPILVIWQFEGTQAMDVYWVESWCLLLCLPMLLLAAHRWRAGRRRGAALLLVACALAAGLADSIRTYAGLAVVVDAVALVLAIDLVVERRLPRLPRGLRINGAVATRLGLAALVVFAYLVPAVLAPAAATAYRDATVHAAQALSGAASHQPETDVSFGGLLGSALHALLARSDPGGARARPSSAAP
jgi:hypothetical protein